jgi:hypothetical protein
MTLLAPSLQAFLSEPADYADFGSWLVDVGGIGAVWFA